MQVILDNGEGHELKVGDHFQWCYKSTEGMFEPYWCKSQMCKYIGTGIMRDLFWSMGNDSSHGALNLDEISLTLLGNIDDYKEVSEYRMKYYDDKDLLNLSHSNHSKGWGDVFFVRKDAKQSKSKMQLELTRCLEKAEYKLSSAQSDIISLQSKLVELESCTELEKFYF